MVKIEFLAFHLEEDGTDCDFDYVIFYDGDSKDSDILAGPFCGPIISFIPEIYSTTEYLTMEFVSDESTAEGGFQATYEQMDGTPCGEDIIRPSGEYFWTIYDRVQARSRAYLKNILGNIKSDGYPNNLYAPNLACKWKIRVTPNSKASLQFVDFEIEASEGCSKDKLEVYDGHRTSSRLLGRFCDEKGAPSGPSELITATTNSVMVIFITDDTVEAKGFKIKYEGSEEGCGGHIYQNTGIVHSPNYPGFYPPLAHCEWDIETNPGTFGISSSVIGRSVPIIGLIGPEPHLVSVNLITIFREWTHFSIRRYGN